MRGGGGADAAKQIGAGCGDTKHAQGFRALQHRLRCRVRWATQAHRVLSTRGHRCHVRAARQDERQRAGPKSGYEFLRKRGHMACETLHAVRAGHMHDERVIGGAAFGFKYLGHRGIVARVGGQAIHRLGRQAQQVTALQGVRSGGDGLGGLTVKNHGASKAAVKTAQCPK